MPPEQPSLLKSTAFWLAAGLTTLLMYWLCLRFFFPKYFAPLSAFHVDFYDYVAAGEKSFLVLLGRYPRPVSYAAMKLLSYGGLLGSIAGIIAIALVNVLLTLAIVRKAFGVASPWLMVSFAAYVLLLFAHPEFYTEHRHDVPAQVSYLFLAISLLTWMRWVSSGSRLTRPLLLVTALLSAGLFVFAKETYFLTALCLVVGLALANRPDRWRHAGFLLFLLVAEGCSFAWSGHIRGPFVNPNASAGDPYKMSLALGSVTRDFLFYLQHLVNPGFVLLVALSLVAAWRDRRRFVLAASFVVAGLAVFAPHSILPNHLFREYAWAAVPLVLAPILLFCEANGSPHARRAQLAFAAIFAALAIVGPLGYRSVYRSDASRWEVAEDRKGGEMAQSLSAFRGINRPSRILVAGLEDATLPWQSGDFVRHEFGDKLAWTVLLPRWIQYREDSRLVQFTSAAHIRLSNFDYVASYRPDESLAAIQPVAEILSRQGYGPLLENAAVSIDWGLRDEAEQFLRKAREQGNEDAAYQRLMSRLQAMPVEPVPAPRIAEFTANPGHISQPDGSGLGVTELFWNAPDGVFCEIHVGAPEGPLLTSGKSGHARTGKWVRNGMQFFLQDVTGGKPLTSENTLAKIKVEVTR